VSDPSAVSDNETTLAPNCSIVSEPSAVSDNETNVAPNCSIRRG